MCYGNIYGCGDKHNNGPVIGAPSQWLLMLCKYIYSCISVSINIHICIAVEGRPEEGAEAVFGTPSQVT